MPRVREAYYRAERGPIIAVVEVPTSIELKERVIGVRRLCP